MKLVGNIAGYLYFKCRNYCVLLQTDRDGYTHTHVHTSGMKHFWNTSHTSHLTPPNQFRIFQLFLNLDCYKSPFNIYHMDNLFNCFPLSHKTLALLLRRPTHSICLISVKSVTTKIAQYTLGYYKYLKLPASFPSDHFSRNQNWALLLLLRKCYSKF